MTKNPSPTRKKIIRTASLSWSLYAFLGGQLKFLNQYYEMMTIGSFNKEVEPLVEKEGIRSVYIPIERTISPIKDLVSIYRLYRTFKKEKPFLVHSMTPKAGLVSMLAAYLARVPKRAHSFTGLIFPTKTGMMRKVLITTDRLICRFATHIFPEGQGVKKDLEQHKVTSKPLKVIANGSIRGLDLEHFDPKMYGSKDNLQLRADYGVLPGDFVFVFVGRLVNDKGLNELVVAFNKVSEQHPEAKLLLVGSDEGESDFLPKATWNVIKSNKQIIEAGHQWDVRPFLAASDSFVFPSYREGFPNVVLEAGAMGLPSIVTDINGSNEIIIENFNGTIIPSQNSIALENAMRIFLKQRDMVKKMATNCRKHIAEKYPREYVWQEVLNEYRKIEMEDLR